MSDKSKELLEALILQFYFKMQLNDYTPKQLEEYLKHFNITIARAGKIVKDEELKSS